MKITHKFQKEVVEDIDFICNKCGNTLARDIDRHYTADPYGIVEYTYTGGYYSNKLEDSQSYTFSLCEDCLATLFETFTIPPATEWLPIPSGNASMTIVDQTNRQEKINKIYEANKKQLAMFLTDKDPFIREYAKLRSRQIGDK